MQNDWQKKELSVEERLQRDRLMDEQTDGESIPPLHEYNGKMVHIHL